MHMNIVPRHIIEVFGSPVREFAHRHITLELSGGVAVRLERDVSHHLNGTQLSLTLAPERNQKSLFPKFHMSKTQDRRDVTRLGK